MRYAPSAPRTKKNPGAGLDANQGDGRTLTGFLRRIRVSFGFLIEVGWQKVLNSEVVASMLGASGQMVTENCVRKRKPPRGNA